MHEANSMCGVISSGLKGFGNEIILRIDLVCIIMGVLRQNVAIKTLS